MESLSDILKRLVPKSTYAGTDTSPAEEESEAEECPRCGGRGWLRANVPIGDPSFGKAVPCSCQAQATEAEQLARLQRYSNLGALTRLTFQALDSKGLSQELEAQRRAQAAQAETARRLAEQPPIPTPPPAQNASLGDGMMPPNPKPGECYARVVTPPSYEERTERVLVKPAGEEVEVIPARYEWAEQRVLVKEAGEKIVEVSPPVYTTVEERILVKPATEKVETIPAVYKTVTERQLVRPAYTTWKKGRGPIEKLDEATGEILCLVEVPAEYKDVEKRVLVTPATTRKITVPAEYTTVRKKVPWRRRRSWRERSFACASALADP